MQCNMKQCSGLQCSGLQCKCRWVDGWMDGWMDRRKDGWMDACDCMSNKSLNNNKMQCIFISYSVQ